MNTKRAVITTLASLGVSVVLALAFLFWPRDTTQISEQDAIAAFRDGQATRTDGSEATKRDRSADRRTPVPGVYTYAAEGQEEVKLGPLPAESRPFPTTITATAVDTGTGCFNWTVNLFVEHTEETRWCTDPVLRLETHTKHQKVGPLTPTFTMTCDPGAMTTATAANGVDPVAATDSTTNLSCHLTVGGGPVSVDTEIDGTAIRSGEEVPIRVGDVDVPTTRITVHFPVSGTINGTWDETTWWSADHLPVRIERTLDLSGPATFKETSRLQLRSLEPSA